MTAKFNVGELAWRAAQNGSPVQDQIISSRMCGQDFEHCFNDGESFLEDEIAYTEVEFLISQSKRILVSLDVKISSKIKQLSGLQENRQEVENELLNLRIKRDYNND